MSETPRSSTAQHYTDGCMTTDCDHETPSRESADSLIRARTILREWAINDGSTKLTMTARDMDTLRGAIALALDSAIREAEERGARAAVDDCVKVLVGFKGGFTLTMDGRLIPDEDGPWMLPGDGVMAIRRAFPAYQPGDREGNQE